MFFFWLAQLDSEIICLFSISFKKISKKNIFD